MSSFGEFLPSDGRHSHHTISSPYPNQDRPKQKKFSDSSSQEKKPIPSFICHDPRSLGSSRNKAEKKSTITRNGGASSSSSQFRRPGSASERSNSKSLVSEDYSRVASSMARPAMDEVAIGAVIGVLSGYIGRYLKDCLFRKTIREKFNSVLERKSNEDSSCDEVFEKMELGMEKVDMLVEDQQGRKKNVMLIKSLKNCIEILAIVASLSGKKSNNDASVCGVPNSHISACAHFYLAIAYKLLKNERVSSRHLLQVFCDSPCLARTYLLPDLWEHLFLPHLLHLKIWYNKELEFNSNEDHSEKKNKKMKVLNKVYNEKMDSGTSVFALYYKQWLKVGATEPPLPVVPLPSITTCRSSRRKSLDSSISNSSINPNLYKAVFGPKIDRQLISFGDKNGILAISKGSEIDEYKCSSVQNEEITNLGRSISPIKIGTNHAKLWQDSQNSDYFQCFSCKNIPTEGLENRKYISKNASIRKETAMSLSTDLVEAIKTICSSDIIAECESGIRVVTRAWLRSPGDPVIEEALTKPNVIESILEVLSASTEDEILELIISILAELVSRNDSIRQIILNSDPQLEMFVKLLKSTTLFLKSAVLLYLSKPQAKQMLSSEWVPLVLRVLEFGDKLQTLFTVQCSPQIAAFYLLDQLLTGFDEDRNLENARQVLSLGGLTLLLRRIEEGEEFHERNKASLIILCCIRAEGSCRGYLADNINKASLLELIVSGTKHNSGGCAFSVLVELLCLDRGTKVLNFLRGLKDGWGGLNIMHILYIYLQKASPEECPLVAVIMLLLDLMEDPFNSSSLYRTEAIEALTASLNCQTSNDGVQDQSARALHLLGCHFSYTGESLTEKSLLHKAGFREFCLEDSFIGKEIVVYNSFHKEEEEVENWQKRAACVLFKSGNKKFLSALSESMANGIPSLSRASLVTISWMSSYLHLVEDRKLPKMALSILMPQLIQSLNYDKDVEERVLASYSLLFLIKSSGCVSVLPSVDKDSLKHLRNLSLVTWTANDLISIFTFQSTQIYKNVS